MQTALLLSVADVFDETEQRSGYSLIGIAWQETMYHTC
jgi:hypothetical protein